MAYENGGDLFTVDPVTGDLSPIVSGPESDLQSSVVARRPWVAFERKVKGDSGPGLLFVSRHDGSGLTQVTPSLCFPSASYSFSPDGKEI